MVWSDRLMTLSMCTYIQLAGRLDRHRCPYDEKKTTGKYGREIWLAMMAQFSITIGPPKKHKQILTVAVSICLLCVYVCLEVSQSKEKEKENPQPISKTITSQN